MEILKMVQDKENTITDREYGALEQELKEVRHDYRNLRQIIELSGITSITKEDVDDIKNAVSKTVHHSKDHSDSISIMAEKIQQFNDELVKLKIKIYTAFSVIGVLFTIVIWLVDLAFQAMDNM